MPEGQRRPGKSFKQLKVLFHWAPEKDKTKLCPPWPLAEGALVFVSGKRKSMSCSESTAIPLPTGTQRARAKGMGIHTSPNSEAQTLCSSTGAR